MSTTKLRIVIAEDEGVIAMLLSEVLEQLGHQVIAVAATEAAAIDAAESCEPDLMIVDAGLGAGSGLAAVDAILHKRFVPHVLVSGDAASVREASNTAVILEKPYSVLDLGEAIERALESGFQRRSQPTHHSMST